MLKSKKDVGTIVIAVVAIVGLLVTGCGCVTPANQNESTISPTAPSTSATVAVSTTPPSTKIPVPGEPSPSAITNSTSDMTKFLESKLKSLGWTIVQPLQKSTNSIGNDIYTGTVAYGRLFLKVQYEICKSAYETASRGLDTKNALIADGYTVTNSTINGWVLQKEGYYAQVIVDTANNTVLLAVQ
jgi:hypothetical protein